MPHNAPAAIRADEVPCPHDLVPDLLGDAFGILFEANRFPAKRRLVTEFGKPLPHDTFVEELLYHQLRETRLCGCPPSFMPSARKWARARTPIIAGSRISFRTRL